MNEELVFLVPWPVTLALHGVLGQSRTTQGLGVLIYFLTPNQMASSHTGKQVTRVYRFVTYVTGVVDLSNAFPL